MNTILILRGWGSSFKNWVDFINLLNNRGYKVYSPDLPGFGDTPLPSQPWSVDDYAKWVKEFCEKENLSQFFLFGHSFGGRIAIKFVVRYPEKIRGLILVNAAGVRREENLDLRQKIILKISRIINFILAAPLFSWFSFPFRGLAYFLAGTRDFYLIKNPVMKETFKKVIAEDLSPFLPKIKIKTLIVWGEKDKMVPLKNAYLIKEKISNSTLKIISNIGHNPHREAPEKLAEIIGNFSGLKPDVSP